MGKVAEDQSEMPVPTGVKYLVWVQFLARFSLKGTQTVLVLFLFEHLELSENLSTELVHIFLAIVNVCPLLGAVLSDGYLALNPILCLLLIPMLDRAIYPLLTKLNIPLPPLRKMVMGMACGVVAFLASGLLQLAIDSTLYGTSTSQALSTTGATIAMTRNDLEGFLNVLPGNDSENATSLLTRQVASTPARISVFWQLPQYVFITLGELLINITGLEFAYTQAPSSMKSLVMSAYSFNSAMGNFLTFALVALLGERLSKANEFFLFAGGCAAATFLMFWNSYGYDYSQSIVPTHPDPMLAEATYVSMNE